MKRIQIKHLYSIEQAEYKTNSYTKKNYYEQYYKYELNRLSSYFYKHEEHNIRVEQEEWEIELKRSMKHPYDKTLKSNLIKNNTLHYLNYNPQLLNRITQRPEDY